MRELRVGIVGAGIMGTDHARIAHRLVSGSRVTALSDIDATRVEALARELDVRTIPTAEELVADSEVDAVVIASHDSTHAALTLAAIEAGKPVLCEKPLAPTVAECQEIVTAEAARASDGGAPLVSVGFMRRFDPAYLALKQAIHDGSIGRTTILNAQSRGVRSAPGATSEFSITASAIHEFDVVPWLLDSPIVEIRWYAPSSAVEGMADPQLMVARTADGTLVTIETFLNAAYGYDIRCEALGSRGAAALVPPAHVVTGAGLRRSTEYPVDWRPRFAEAYRIEVQAWVDAVRAGTTSPLASAGDGLRATRVAEAAIASMHTGGEPVRIEP